MESKDRMLIPINVRVKLSALWIALMFCYTYADILGFYAPGNLEELIAGEIAGIRMTQQLLLGSAALMIVPTIMIYLSLVMRTKLNRIMNIVMSVIYLGVLGSTFLTGRNPSYYILFAVVKAALLVLIIWQSVKWVKIEMKE